MTHKLLIMFFVKILVWTLAGSTVYPELPPARSASPDFACIDQYVRSEARLTLEGGW